ncbi:MAG: pilus assembly protein PilX [Proteobacteria bacterium]|nr:pilus assembly protein PilX [Pseudomonadota bacterium]
MSLRNDIGCGASVAMPRLGNCAARLSSGFPRDRRLGAARSADRQRGVALVISLLLLVVATILAVSMFRSFGVQEKIAGNIREKQRALHAAVTAQQYGEFWLSQGTNAQMVPTTCNTLLNANLLQGQICSNLLKTSVSQDYLAYPDWQIGGADVGVLFTPQTMNVTTTADTGTYYATPRFYISILGPSADGQGTVFQVDARGYGGTANAVSIVESTYAVQSAVVNRGGP